MPPKRTSKKTDTYTSKKPLRQREFPPHAKTVREKAAARRDVIDEENRVTTDMKTAHSTPVPRARRKKGGQAKEIIIGAEETLSTPLTRSKKRKMDMENEGSDKENAIGSQGAEKTPTRTGTLRRRTTVQDSEDEDASSHTPKRRKVRQIQVVKTEEDVMAVDRDVRENVSDLEQTNLSRRNWARQQTLTQNVRGTRPRRGDPEPPEFNPQSKKQKGTKSKKSNSKKKGVGRSQRTLTQMVPLSRRTTLPDSEDESEDLVEHTEYNHALHQHFEDSGIFAPADEQEQFQGPPKEHSTTKTAAELANPPSPDRQESDKENMPPGDGDSAYFSAKKLVNSRHDLNTPRRVPLREIPSSQSPADSEISPFKSDQRSQRSPLLERLANAQNIQANTPLRKQVTFRDTPVDVFTSPSASRSIRKPHPRSPTPARRRVFKEIIPDSQDEDEEYTFLSDGESMSDYPLNIGHETQMMRREMNRAFTSVSPNVPARRADFSPELGALGRRPGTSSALSAEKGTAAWVTDNETAAPRASDKRGHIPPVVIDSTDEEDVLDDDSPTPSKPHSSTSRPSSATTKQETQISTTSNSLEAETQLQDEFATFMQHQGRTVPTSSMNVAPESGLSYQQTPHLRTTLIPTQGSLHASQATTVDNSSQASAAKRTPRKHPTTAPTLASPSPMRTTPRRTQVSTQVPASPDKTTPRRNITDQQPFISPMGPPPLVIPSSVPNSLPSSPRKGDSWSSPTLTRGIVTATQMVQDSFGTEIFSEPPRPPWEDEDEE